MFGSLNYTVYESSIYVVWLLSHLRDNSLCHEKDSLNRRGQFHYLFISFVRIINIGISSVIILFALPALFKKNFFSVGFSKIYVLTSVPVKRFFETEGVGFPTYSWTSKICSLFYDFLVFHVSLE